MASASGRVKHPVIPTSTVVPHLTVDNPNTPNIVFRVVTDENGRNLKDKSGYISRHRYATEAGEDTPAAKHLFLELCCEIWNLRIDKDGYRVGIARSFPYSLTNASRFVSTAAGLPWLLSNPSVMDHNKPATLIAIDLHAVIRAGILCYDAKTILRSKQELAKEVYMWGSNDNLLENPFVWGRAETSFHQFLEAEDRRHDIFIRDHLPFTCIIGTYDYKGVQSGLEKSQWLLPRLTQPPHLAITEFTDPHGMRRKIWKAGKIMSTYSQTDWVYAQLGTRLKKILEENVHPSNVKSEAATDLAIDDIFGKYIELELELYTAVSTHVKLCINGADLTFKKSDNSAHHQPFEAFHAKAPFPKDGFGHYMKTCDSVSLQIMDCVNAETISATCQISTNEIDDKKHPVIFFEGKVNTLLSKKAVSPSVPMNQITKLSVHVKYTLAELDHTFVIHLEHPQH